MYEHTSFTWLHTNVTENLVSPVFVRGLGAPDYYFKNTISSYIITICESRSETLYQHFWRYSDTQVRLFNDAPKFARPIYGKSLI